jgi:D-erythro-7,8-dihydroneopterin triphosphate epimerase
MSDSEQSVATAPPARSPAQSRDGATVEGFASRATINVHNLRLRTFIGFNPEERSKQQDVVINIEIDYALNPGVFDDEVAQALNYKTITKDVINHVENGRFLLLEKLAADVLALCSDHPVVERARVRIDKPHALRFADSVSMTLEYNSDINAPPRGTSQ